jgi:hypothetical protein
MKIDPIGDVRAEHDKAMLDVAFYEWSAYKALLADSKRFVVVGRRGTGKSALAYRLSEHWKAEKRFCINIAPQEEELIGFRAIASLFGDSVTMIRAGVKLLWKYSLIMEMADSLSKYYKTSSVIALSPQLNTHLKKWQLLQGGTFLKIRRLTIDWLKELDSPESRIAETSERLQVSSLLQELRKIMSDAGKQGVVLVDRLDEGYIPDQIGIGVVDGLVYGTGEFREGLGDDHVALVFLRDNIFRSLQSADNDFSRNVEPRVVRLHWDPQELLYMAISRIRSAFDSTKEGEIKTWNAFTENELHGVSGFKKCLQHTLYRPRDVIALLNGAFFEAQKNGRKTLIQKDITTASQVISKSRLDDLEKEYSSVFPGLKRLLSKFNASNLRTTPADVQRFIFETLGDPETTPIEYQHLLILSKDNACISALYSIGFLGIKNDVSKTFVFCHDGRLPNKSITNDTELIIHPCYWPALGKNELFDDENLAEEIFDEYEVTIYSADADQRSQILGRAISALPLIPLGNDGAAAFEEWCAQAINFCFSYHLSNVVLHPNKNAKQRRDVVATNGCTGISWKRIQEDYQTRQVIFEIKNYEELSVEEFRQVHGYLDREYGKLAFIICRAKTNELTSSESMAFREFYKHQRSSMIIKITANWLVNALSKLRSPQKHDFADAQLSKLMDEYVRVYANEQTTKKAKNKSRSK